MNNPTNILLDKFKNSPAPHRIAISGDPGSGKTTFAREVSELLGYELITTGNIFRKIARDKGISVTELNKLAENNKEFDDQVDNFLKGLNDQPGNYILDSRMAWHFVHDAIKIRLTVAPEISAQRIFNDPAEYRERFSCEKEAITDIENRRKSEVHRYFKLYQVDISAPENFDLVIDSSHKTRDDIMAEFYNFIDNLTSA